MFQKIKQKIEQHLWKKWGKYFELNLTCFGSGRGSELALGGMQKVWCDDLNRLR